MTNAETLKRLLREATKGPWQGYNMVNSDTGETVTPSEIAEYVENSVKMGDPSRFLFVSGLHDDGGACDICHTGNGPRGPANTALIALAPDMAAELIDLRNALKAIGKEARKNKPDADFIYNRAFEALRGKDTPND